MRRKDREVLGDENIKQIIEQCTTCHVALEDEVNPGMPYVVPLSFGYSLQNGTLELVFHCAHVGKKLDCIRKNPKVAFSMCVENRIEIFEDNVCKSGRYYASVMGQGTAEIVEDPAEKCQALSLLMERQAGGAQGHVRASHAACGNQEAHISQDAAPHPFTFTPEQARAVTVIRIVSTNYTAKEKKPATGC